MMTDSNLKIARLKRRIDALSRPSRGAGAGLFALDGGMLDARLGGGLAQGALHEVLGQSASASGFAVMLALRCAGDKPILWVRTDNQERELGGVYAPGLVELGVDPDAIIMVHAPDELSGLRVAADIIGCAGVGAALLEAGQARKLDLTASRRLVLAAEKSGVTGVVLRSAQSSFASAASTRWQVAAAPSLALPGESPGITALNLALLRHRGGVAPFDMTMEWDRDQRAFRAPLSRAVPAFPPRRALEEGERAAA